jgi:hypothetical protein
MAEVERLSAGQLDVRDGATELTGVQIDSRRIVDGDLFVVVGAAASSATRRRRAGRRRCWCPTTPLRRSRRWAGRYVTARQPK